MTWIFCSIILPQGRLTAVRAYSIRWSSTFRWFGLTATAKPGWSPHHFLSKDDVLLETEALHMRHSTWREAHPELLSKQNTDYIEATVPLKAVTFIHNPINILAKEPLVWWQLQQLMEVLRRESTSKHPTQYVISRCMTDFHGWLGAGCPSPFRSTPWE